MVKTIVKWIQKLFPRGVRAARGWCLKYVDDEGRAPHRTANARIAMQNESKAGRLSKATPPLNIWVCLYLDLRGGAYTNYDHVALGKYKGNGKWEIRDSESESGYRSRYTSLASWLAWFANYSPVYKGWSYMTDGAKWAEKKVTKVSAPKKSNDTIAKEVLAGKGGWGNEPTRSKKLKAAGYNPATIQAIVNKLWAAKNKKPVPKPAAKKYHTVKRGDTMSGIAVKYKTTLAKLDKLNPQIKNLNKISVGQKVRVK